MVLMLLRSGNLEEFGRSGLPFVRRRGRGEKIPTRGKNYFGGKYGTIFGGNENKGSAWSPYHNPQLPQFSNFSVPQCIVKPTFSNIDNVIFPDILRLTNDKRKFISEDDMTSTLLSVLSRYGVTQFR